mgnify:FL=1|jgi:hypothetical protein
MIDAPLPSNTDRLLRLGKSFSASLKTLSTSVPSSQYRYCKKTIESTMTSHSYMVSVVSLNSYFHTRVRVIIYGNHCLGT